MIFLYVCIIMGLKWFAKPWETQLNFCPKLVISINNYIYSDFPELFIICSHYYGIGMVREALGCSTYFLSHISDFHILFTSCSYSYEIKMDRKAHTHESRKH